MSGKYNEYQQLNLPSISEEILAKWNKESAFEKSVELREGNQSFVFYEGPPSANGMPGIHHVISRTLKDLVCRYKTMQGFQVKRKGGWDTHGLPIELGVEKELGITKEDIGVKISVEDYNKKCREVVMRFKDKWDDITQKMGYWVDLKNPYVTFENNYIETLWWCLSELYKKGYLYQSVSIQPYSPAAGTGLSSHELNQPGTYKDVKDTSCVAAFEVIDYENRLISIKQLDNLPFEEIVPENGSDIKNYRKEVKKWAYENLRNQPVTNSNLTELIYITRKGIDEVLAFSPIAEEILVLKYAKKILPNAVVLHKEHSSGKDGADFYYLGNKVKIGEGYFLLKTVLKKTDKLALYDMRLMPIKKSQQLFAAHLSKRDDENLPGQYKDKRLLAIIQLPKIVYTLHSTGFNQPYSLLAWTTTPWTLPSNLGLTVGEKIDYCLVKTINPYTHKIIHVVLAENLLAKYLNPQHEGADFNLYKNDGKNLPYQNLLKVKGSDLDGLQYHQLLPSAANTVSKIQEITHGAQPFKVITGDFVTTEDGTGIVHTAPAFGADDFKAGQKNNLGILTLVDKQGKFIEGVGEFSNRYVKNYKDEKDYVDVNIDIAVKLKKENRAFKVEKYEHSYPHCWRTDKPIIYYPLDAWFIKTTAVKDRMVELNKTINWKPASTGSGRFGNWLENMVDWNLSRSRFWGTPLPIWKTEDDPDGYREEKCISSIQELQDEIKKSFEAGCSKVPSFGGDLGEAVDLHKPYVDEIILVSPTGKPMKRVADLIDVWFDSGAMPYAQWHFPFDNIEEFAKNYPADFIAEGVDQTRGWFYTLHALAALLKESIEEELAKHNLSLQSSLSSSTFPSPSGRIGGAGLAYKTVVSNGLVLDKAGNKMSKRLGNVVDPFATINTFGADATRWYLITNASPWDSLKFDVEGIKEVQRKFFGTLYNTYQFFALYANVDGFAFKEKYIPVKERPEIDQWILSSLNTLIKDVQENFDAYEPTQAGRAIEGFVDAHLSNWYVRLCRRRFWKGEYEQDKICAYQTLYECLETLCKLMAPVAPFFADWLFNNLNAVSNRFKIESVHHTDFPKTDDSVIDTDLEKRMQLAQDISSLILSLRKKVNLKVRQPLQKVFIPALDTTMASRIKKVEDIIKAETNIKEVDILGAENDFIRKKAKANFKTLGKKLGAKMKWAAEQIAEFDNATIDKVLESEYILNPGYETAGEEPIIITADDLEISTDEIPGYEVAVKGQLTVALDIIITADLKKEGDAREFVNRIQNIRKESGFNLIDRIDVLVSENGGLQPSIIQYKDYICAEILADSLAFLPAINSGIEIEVNDVILQVNVLKKG